MHGSTAAQTRVEGPRRDWVVERRETSVPVRGEENVGLAWDAAMVPDQEAG